MYKKVNKQINEKNLKKNKVNVRKSVNAMELSMKTLRKDFQEKLTPRKFIISVASDENNHEPFKTKVVQKYTPGVRYAKLCPGQHHPAPLVTLS